MESIKEFFSFMVDPGTNTLIWDFVTNNALLLGAIAAVTPWTWDNRFLDYLKGNKKDK